MRVFAIIFTVIVCLGLMSIENVYGLPFVSPEYSYDTAKHVIVGRVISVEFLKDPNSQYFDQKYREMAGLALYEIHVEEYMKNPMENPTIQVLGRYIDQKQTLYYESFPYEINQRVLLYLKTSDIPQYDLMIDPRSSRAISEDFSAKQMLEDLKNKSAPLQQIKFGLSINEIVCKNNLILIQKYDGSPACVTESTKTTLIERGWTSSSTTVMINSSFEQDRDRVYTDPRNVVIDLGKNNSVKWVNNADYTVQVYDYENKSWSIGQIDPSMSSSIRFNSTGYYEFVVESANDRHFGKIIVISADTNSLPVETRMKMGMSIVSNDLGNNPTLIGVSIGDVNDGIVIDINQKELEKRDDAQSYYYDMYKEMIPFDVPITIEFTEPLKLLE